MKNIITVLVLAISLMSCSTEEVVETQDLGFALNAVETFEGEYLNYETLINGEVSDTCDTTWVFNTNGTMRIDRVVDCVDGPASSGLVQFSSDNDELSVTIYGHTELYSYNLEGNGDLVLTHQSGDYTVTYKLTR